MNQMVGYRLLCKLQNNRIFYRKAWLACAIYNSVVRQKSNNDKYRLRFRHQHIRSTYKAEFVTRVLSKYKAHGQTDSQVGSQVAKSRNFHTYNWLMRF